MEYYDNEVFDLINEERSRQENTIELIASENFTSPAVMKAMGSVLTNKYAEGYPGKRYYGGCQYIDKIEQLAIDRVKELYHAEYANVQPHSGAQANLAVQYAVLRPGDTLLGMSLDQGGHLTHGSKVNISGNYFNSVSYGVTPEGYIDIADFKHKVFMFKPKLICVGASAYPREINFKDLRDEIEDVKSQLIGYDPVFWVDMAHIAGLVAAGEHMSPIPYADVVTSTTHKTLRGPRGGFILATNKCNDKYNFNKAVFPGIQGGPLEHIIAAKAVCFKEAMQPEFREYQKQIKKNTYTLAEALKIRGFELISKGTDNHLILVNLRNKNITGKAMQDLCEKYGITLNKNSIPNDPLSSSITSGVRIGTAAVTTRGFKEEDMITIAEMLNEVTEIFNSNNGNVNTPIDNVNSHIAYHVKRLCNKYPLNYKESLCQ